MRTDAPRDLAELIEVRCVNQVAHDDPRARIKAIGGLRDGITWKLSQSDAIEAMERGDARFYVRIDNHSAGMVIAADENGNRYLKCSTDGKYPMSLLRLPECPGSSRQPRAHFEWADDPRRGNKSK